MGDSWSCCGAPPKTGANRSPPKLNVSAKQQRKAVTSEVMIICSKKLTIIFLIYATRRDCDGVVLETSFNGPLS